MFQVLDASKWYTSHNMNINMSEGWYVCWYDVLLLKCFSICSFVSVGIILYSVCFMSKMFLNGIYYTTSSTSRCQNGGYCICSCSQVLPVLQLHCSKLVKCPKIILYKLKKKLIPFLKTWMQTNFLSSLVAVYHFHSLWLSTPLELDLLKLGESPSLQLSAPYNTVFAECLHTCCRHWLTVS